MMTENALSFETFFPIRKIGDSIAIKATYPTLIVCEGVRADLSPKSPLGRPRKIDWQELETDIPADLDQLLFEPADQLGVLA